MGSVYTPHWTILDCLTIYDSICLIDFLLDNITDKYKEEKQ